MKSVRNCTFFALNIQFKITMFKYLCMGLYALCIVQESVGDICATCFCSNTSIGRTIDCHAKQLASNDMLNSDLLLLDEHQMLNKLIISKNEIIELPPHILKKLKQLRSLDLSDNLMRNVHANVFTDLHKLEELNFSRNRLEAFDSVLLGTLPSLSSLNLSHNCINLIEHTIETTEIKLRTLDLSYNNISEIPSALFMILGNLESLDLSFNEIKYLEEESLLQLRSLQTLYMQNNKLSSLNLKIFPKSLAELNCGFNDIADVKYDTLSIKRLSMEHNMLSIIPTDLMKLTQLQYLNVSGNSLENFPNITLQQLKNLDISNNNLSEIPDTFSTFNFPTLESLNISGNPLGKLKFPSKITLTTFSATNMSLLQVIEQDSFRNLTVPLNDCLNLVISNNKKLSVLHESSLEHLHICSLDLSKNKLTSLSPRLISLKSDFKTYRVNLQGNPFNCNCTLQWMLNDLIPKLYHSQPRLLDNLRCNTPLPISNMRMIHWYAWKGDVFCSNITHLRQNYIMESLDSSNTEVITFESSAGMFAAIGTTIAILTILTIVGLLLTRKLSMRRRRLNRRL